MRKLLTSNFSPLILAAAATAAFAQENQTTNPTYQQDKAGMTTKTRVIKTANGAYIDNIPPLKWEGRNGGTGCTYSGAVATILNAIGKNATYEQVAGLAGSCYHLGMCYGWNYGSSLINTSYHHQKIDCDWNALRAFGIDYYTLGEQDKEAYGEHARKSIDAGFPVLLLGLNNPPEWCILTGYEKDGAEFKYFGRTYCDPDDIPENELYTGNRYVLGKNFPGEHPQGFFRLLDRPCEPTPPKDALKISLQTCLDMFKPNNEVKFGCDAYAFMIESFNKNEYPDSFSKENASKEVIRFMLDLLLDERRAAHIHLSQSADLLSGENKTKLATAAGLFKEMHDTLYSVIPRDKQRKEEYALTPEFRKELADALRKMSALEKQARDIVADILNNWETENIK